MKTYHTTCYEICKVTRRVEATSEEEAKKLAENGDGEFLDSEMIGEPDKARTLVKEEENE